MGQYLVPVRNEGGLNILQTKPPNTAGQTEEYVDISAVARLIGKSANEVLLWCNKLDEQREEILSRCEFPTSDEQPTKAVVRVDSSLQLTDHGEHTYIWRFWGACIVNAIENGDDSVPLGVGKIVLGV